MEEPIVSVRGIGKQYFLGASLSNRMLREQMTEGFQRIFRKSPKKAPKREAFWALQEISFDVAQGEVLGIIGRKGAGKSTLLKVLSEITEPTVGEIHIQGHIASLLEVGTGFHPELTGRENIYLNGAILGMPRSDIGKKLDEIVAFSGVERFIDTPVKRYSSGMYVRLAFSVAAHLEPEILVIDEVLAVGDFEFQKRCLGKIGQVARSGRTILFVSHNMTIMNEFCERCLLLDQGKLVDSGPTGRVIDHYLETMTGNDEPDLKPPVNSDAWITQVSLRHDAPSSSRTFRMGETLIVEIAYQTRTRVDQLGFGIIFEDSIQNVRIFASLSTTEGLKLENVDGEGRVNIRFPNLCLVPGRYRVSVNLNAKHYQYDRRVGIRVLDVVGEDELGTGFVLNRQQNGIVWLPHEWDLDQD